VRTIRQILRTEYIGAILIALLVSDAVGALFTALTQQISYYSYFGPHHLPETPYRASHWNSMLMAVLRIVLYLASAYVLARWLYGSNAVALEDDTDLHHRKKEP
jgi:ABC-type Fe3+ transport system permease subunit